MTPRILMVGHDAKGAWEMRGRQLGKALGARVTTTPSGSDFAWAQVIVLVKRAAMRWSGIAQTARRPVIWDALDFWQQPEENHLTEGEHVEAFKRLAAECGASLVIGATQAMAKAIGGVYLPHHSRIGLVPAPIRTEARVVAYEGAQKYLGRWHDAIEKACGRLGMSFVVNPKNLATADLIVAFRDGRWDGWACRNWKSGVKYVNAIAAGRPILTQHCAAAYEISARGAFVDAIEDLERAILGVSDVDRQEAYRHGVERSGEFTVDAIARRYSDMIGSVLARAA